MWMLRHIRRRLLALVQRPDGRLGGMLMVVALLSAGIPSGELHAHADGYDSHEHVVVSAGAHLDVQHAAENAADPDQVEVLHSHDACISVSALPPVQVMVPKIGSLVVDRVRAVVATAPLTPRIAPYRPPIV